MPRIVLKMMLWMIPLLTTAMVAIRVRPYDDPDLTRLLTPEDCSAPCFLGIQPGITTASEAVDLLENHRWVGYVEPHYIAPGSGVHLRGFVYWDWKPDAPIWFRSNDDTMLGHDGAFDMLDNVVQSVTVLTNVPYGAMQVMVGRPTGFSLSFSDVVVKKGVFVSASLRYRDVYLGAYVQTEAVSPCPDVPNLWFEPSKITFFGDTQIAQRSARFIYGAPFMTEVYALRRTVCRGFR